MGFLLHFALSKHKMPFLHKTVSSYREVSCFEFPEKQSLISFIWEMIREAGVKDRDTSQGRRKAKARILLRSTLGAKAGRELPGGTNVGRSVWLEDKALKSSPAASVPQQLVGL